MAEILFGELFYLNLLGTAVSGHAIVENIQTNYGGPEQGIYHDISIRCYQRDYVEESPKPPKPKVIESSKIRLIRGSNTQKSLDSQS